MELYDNIKNYLMKIEETEYMLRTEKLKVYHLEYYKNKIKNI